LSALRGEGEGEVDGVQAFGGGDAGVEVGKAGCQGAVKVDDGQTFGVKGMGGDDAEVGEDFKVGVEFRGEWAEFVGDKAVGVFYDGVKGEFLEGDEEEFGDAGNPEDGFAEFARDAAQVK